MGSQGDSYRPDPAFEAVSQALISLSLCEVRLMLDRRWPWLVLIPRRPGLVELEDLSTAERATLMEEIVLAGAAVRAIGAPVEKLNVGALGNITRQLHIHVVGRREGDPAWPGPVWGFGVAEAYGAAELEQATAAAMRVLAG